MNVIRKLQLHSRLSAVSAKLANHEQGGYIYILKKREKNLAVGDWDGDLLGDAEGLEMGDSCHEARE